MRIGSVVMRAISAALLVLVAAGTFSRVSAQDADTSGATASVAVSCWANAATGGTDCAFTPSAGVTNLTVPAPLLCAPVLATGAASWTGDGVSQAISGDSIVLSFAGSVAPGGGGLYIADVDGASGVSIGGAGIVCGIDAPSVTSEDVSIPTQEPTEQVVDPTQEPTEQAVDPTEAPTEPAVDSAGIPADATPGASDITDDTPDSTGDEPPIGPDVTTVTVTVGAFLCAVDPGVADPATVAECLPAAGVAISGTADGADLGTLTTDDSGTVSFAVDDGSALSFSEDGVTAPAGYTVIGSGTVTGTASDGLTLSFAYIASGRLQLVNGSCPTSGDTRTEFRVIEPKSVVESATPACAVTAGGSFTISAGGLSSDLVVTTGDDGAWRGYLPAGDYTVTENASGESTGVTVVADDISVVIAVDYVSAPLGVVNVSRFLCDHQDSAGLAIEVSGKRSAFASDDDCTATNGDITIDVQTEVSTTSIASFRLGADGKEEIELPSGSYVITDVSTTKTASFDVVAGRRVYVAIVDKVVGGDSVGGGGDDPGGSDGTGNPDRTPTPTTGGGDGGSGDGSTDGTDSGVGSGSTDGGIDAGTTDSGGESGVADVTALPNTGARLITGASDETLLFLFAGALLAGAAGIVCERRRRPAA